MDFELHFAGLGVREYEPAQIFWWFLFDKRKLFEVWCSLVFLPPYSLCPDFLDVPGLLWALCLIDLCNRAHWRVKVKVLIVKLWLVRTWRESFPLWAEASEIADSLVLVCSWNTPLGSLNLISVTSHLSLQFAKHFPSLRSFDFLLFSWLLKFVENLNQRYV